MGSVASYVASWSSPWTQSTTPDPATGLSEKDRFLINKSWEHVTDPKVLGHNASQLFLQLFEKFPHMKNYFSAFKNMSDEKLRTSAILRIHAIGVIYAVSAYVQHTDDPETLVGLVQKICNAHYDRGLTTKDFEDLATMFVPYLKTLIGKEVTPETEEAWTKLLSAQTAIFKATVEKRKT